MRNNTKFSMEDEIVGHRKGFILYLRESKLPLERDKR